MKTHWLKWCVHVRIAISVQINLFHGTIREHKLTTGRKGVGWDGGLLRTSWSMHCSLTPIKCVHGTIGEHVSCPKKQNSLCTSLQPCSSDLAAYALSVVLLREEDLKTYWNMLCILLVSFNLMVKWYHWKTGWKTCFYAGNAVPPPNTNADKKTTTKQTKNKKATETAIHIW